VKESGEKRKYFTKILPNDAAGGEPEPEDLSDDEYAEAQPAKKTAAVRRVLFALVVVILVVAVALTIAFSGELSIDGVKIAFSRIMGLEAREYNFYEGYDACFTDLGTAIVTAGKQGVAVYDILGNEIAHQAISVQYPALTSNGSVAAVWSVGGKDVIFADKTGILAIKSFEYAVETVSIGRGGWTAVSTGEGPDYLGAVYLYKIKGSELIAEFEWYSGTGYVLGAAINDDNTMLAVLSVGENGARVVLIGTSDTKPTADLKWGDIIEEIAYTSDDYIIARTRNEILRISQTGTVTVLYDLAYASLDAYTVAGTFAALAFSDSSSNYIVTITTAGEVSKANVPNKVTSLRAASGKVAALSGDKLLVYADRTLERVTRFENVSGVSDAYPRSATSAVAFGARHGYRFTE